MLKSLYREIKKWITLRVVISLILTIVITASLFYMTTLRFYVVQGETVIQINSYSLVFAIVSVFSILGYWIRDKKIVRREGNGRRRTNGLSK